MSEPASDSEAPEDDAEPRSGWLSRILWFVGLWAASVAVLGAVAFAIRTVLR